MNDPLRVGVLGIARGSWFARALAHTRQARLAALCARHQDRLERLASNLGSPVALFTSYEAMLDFFSPVPSEGFIGLQGTRGGCRVSVAEASIHVDGLTPRNEWQSLWDFQDRLGPEWKEVPAVQVARGFDSGLSLLIDDFARAALARIRPPMDVVDALNMSAPGWASEQSREQGGTPVPVEQYDGTGLPGRG